MLIDAIESANDATGLVAATAEILDDHREMVDGVRARQKATPRDGD